MLTRWMRGRPVFTERALVQRPVTEGVNGLL